MSFPEHDYISQRIIDACLHENLFGITNPEHILAELPLGAPIWNGETANSWLKISVPSGRLYLPLQKSHYMQSWRAVAPTWLLETVNEWCVESGYRAWLLHLAEGQDQQTQNAFEEYCLEAETAITHRQLCNSSYQ